MTTAELKLQDGWPVVEAGIKAAIESARQVFPNDKIELVDKGTCFHIEVNGNPITEIDAEYLNKPGTS